MQLWAAVSESARKRATGSRRSRGGYGRAGPLDSGNAGARLTLIKSPGDARHVPSHMPGMSGIMH